jgi:hypothetical protein
MYHFVYSVVQLHRSIAAILVDPRATSVATSPFLVICSVSRWHWLLIVSWGMHFGFSLFRFVMYAFQEMMGV